MSENIPMKYGLKYGTVLQWHHFGVPKFSLFYVAINWDIMENVTTNSDLGFFLKTFIQRTAIVKVYESMQLGDVMQFHLSSI